MDPSLLSNSSHPSNPAPLMIPGLGELSLPTLHRASAEQYGSFAQRAKHNEFWWYCNGLAPWRGYSRPFTDESGRWWYRVKPAFAWPVNFFDPFPDAPTGRAFRRLLGWQYPVTPAPFNREGGGEGNSIVRMNVIENLQDFDLNSVSESKRRALRKAVKALEVIAMDPADADSAHLAHEVWKSHVERTGWNKPLTADHFVSSWKELSAWPGTTVLAARAPADNWICAWLIARWIDDVIYVDTLASHTQRLENRPNDLVAFFALMIAKAQGAKRAHYSLKSNIVSLEAFKQSLGFTAREFPARLCLRGGVGIALRALRPRLYQRLLGADSQASEHKST